MKLAVEQRPPREAVLSVTLDAPEIEPYLERTYKKVVGRLNVQGFRKGKAPRKVIEQLYGKQYLLNEALEEIINETTSKAVVDNALEVAGVPSVSLENLEPLTFKATVPLTPTVDLRDYERLRVPKDRVRITKSQIDQSLEEMRQGLAPWEPVAGPVALEDLVNITVHGWTTGDDGKRADVAKNDKVDYIPREHSRVPVPGFAERLVGLSAGTKQSFEVSIPADFDSAELAGKTVSFDVTVHEVKRKHPATLDDEFAKGVGSGFPTLAALRESLRADLAKQEEANTVARHQEETMTKVVGAALVEVSPLIIDHEMEHYIDDQAQSMRTGQMTIEQYQNYIAWSGKSAEEIRDLARPRAEERLKRALVLREVVKRHDVQATDDEVAAEIETLAQSAGTEAKQVRDHFKSAENRESLRRVAQNRKAIELLSKMAMVQVSSTPSLAATASAAAPGEAAPEEEEEPVAEPAAPGGAPTPAGETETAMDAGKQGGT